MQVASLSVSSTRLSVSVASVSTGGAACATGECAGDRRHADDVAVLRKLEAYLDHMKGRDEDRRPGPRGYGRDGRAEGAGRHGGAASGRPELVAEASTLKASEVSIGPQGVSIRTAELTRAEVATRHGSLSAYTLTYAETSLSVSRRNLDVSA